MIKLLRDEDMKETGQLTQPEQALEKLEAALARCCHVFPLFGIQIVHLNF